MLPSQKQEDKQRERTNAFEVSPNEPHGEDL
jgi:hypothetical protein